MHLSVGTRLASARAEAAISLEDLARRAGVDVTVLERFERDQGTLGLGVAMKVAKVLGIPPTSFVHSSLPSVPIEPKPTLLLRQMHAISWVDDSDRDALALALTKARSYLELAPLSGHDDLVKYLRPTPAPNERPHLAGYAQALTLRAHLLQPQAPIRNLRRLIEDRFGIFVMEHAFADGTIAGAAVRAGNARAIILGKRPVRETAMRFTLAHELGHHVLDLEERDARADQGDLGQQDVIFERSAVEKRANAFAAMLLAPENGVSELLGAPAAGSIGMDQARQLAIRVAAHFGLGFTAVVRHLNDLRYYDKATADFLASHAEGPAVSGFEDEGRFDGLERRVFFALEHEQISVGRARELIGVRVNEAIGYAS